MFRWLINKEVRAELDDCWSMIKKLKASMDALETNMASLRGHVHRTKYAESKSNKTKSGEDEGSPEENPSLADLPPEARDFYHRTIEFQQAEKFKKMSELGNEWESDK